MKDSLVKLISVGLIIGGLDYIYLGLVMKMFKKSILNIQGKKLSVRLLPTILAYILLIGTFYYFVIVKKFNLLDSFLLGIAIYGIYDLTNYATINKWSLRFAVTDTLWGGTLFLLTLAILKLLKLVK